MLGLFDSGLGGLTVVRRVRSLLPTADLVFFADQAHVPYGNRPPEDLRGLLRHNLRWLDEQNVDAIVMGCNTSCAIADRYGWPATRAVVLDLIDSAAIAVERAGYRRIGVVATAATASSGAYGRKIRARVPGASVVEVAAPELVPLVEAGRVEGEEPRAAVRRACEGLPRDLDAVVLACTHYPILDAHFAAALGAGTARLDPAVVQAERAVLLADELRFGTGSGLARYVTNADADAFRANVVRIIGDPDPRVERLARQPIRT